MICCCIVIAEFVVVRLDLIYLYCSLLVDCMLSRAILGVASLVWLPLVGLLFACDFDLIGLLLVFVFAGWGLCSR